MKGTVCRGCFNSSTVQLVTDPTKGADPMAVYLQYVLLSARERERERGRNPRQNMAKPRTLRTVFCRGGRWEGMFAKHPFLVSFSPRQAYLVRGLLSSTAGLRSGCPGRPRGIRKKQEFQPQRHLQKPLASQTKTVVRTRIDQSGAFPSIIEHQDGGVAP